MIKPVYISGSAAISPQHSLSSDAMWNEIVVTYNNRLKCIEPVYTGYLNPVSARRMGRIVKMGIASAVECLKGTGTEMPGAIITGTALGCLGDTEKFLTSVIKDDEQFLTPTWFIQSLQNTVSAQIALHLKCMNHNFTFVHKGFSFESALIDGIMLMYEEDADNVLIGGLDEMTDHNFTIYNRLGKWKQEPIRSDQLLKHSHTKGTIAGEGAAFFVLSKQPQKNSSAKLSGVKTIYTSANTPALEAEVLDFLNEQRLTVNDVSVVLYGINGDPENDKPYLDLINGAFKNNAAGYFKHLCGEYQTSSSFAMWLGCNLIKSGVFPEQINYSANTPKELKNILIVNRYENNYSLLLLSAV